jgi:hypothetical protein
LFRRRDRVRFITRRQARHHGRGSPSRVVRLQEGPLPDGRCPGNLFSKDPALPPVHPVHGLHCGQASGVRCIPRGKGRLVRALSELDQDFLRRGRRAQAAVLAVRHAGRDSVTFLAG